MQLILESEPTLPIERDMSESAVEDIHTEKVGNSDIDKLSEKKCNGNKENIADVNLITNDDKQVVEVENEENDTLGNLPVNIKSENNNPEKTTVEAEDIKEEISEVNGDEENITQIEESEKNGSDEETNIINIIERKTENKAEETVQNNIEEEEDIISIKEENFNQLLDVLDKDSDEKSVVSENDVTAMAVSENDKTAMVVSENDETAMVVSENDNTATVVSENDETAMVVSENDDNSTVVSDNDETAIVVSENDKTAVVVSENDKTGMVVSENDETAIVLSENDKAATVVSKNDETAMVVPENDETATKEQLPSTKDDVEVTEEAVDTPIICDINQSVLTSNSLEEIGNTKESTENIDKLSNDDNKNVEETQDCESAEVISSKEDQDSFPIELKNDMDVEQVFEEPKSDKQGTVSQEKDTPPAPVYTIIDKPIVCKLSNTLDILSDDEDEPPKAEPPVVEDSNDKQCISIEDDDDIMLIDEDTTKTETPLPIDSSIKEETPIKAEDKTSSETNENKVEETTDLFAKTEVEESTPPAEPNDVSPQINISEKQEENEIQKCEPDTPLLKDNFLKTAKKNLADMTREDLEEFCILKIVESIVDRSNLSEIKNKLKTMAQGIEEYRKKAMMLTKQNRDLQVVLKSVQEEQKKMTPDTPITPLKITRSVGMQVYMEKTGARRKSLAQLQNTGTGNNNVNNRQTAKNSSAPSPRAQKQPATNQSIPVPRLVPANNPAMKTPSTVPLINQIAPNKTASPIPNGIKTPSPSQKVAEKRQHNRTMSITVDLTDDEPPAKTINNRTSPAPPVRLVPSQNLMANPRQQFTPPVSNSPRKVYIPISGPQNHPIRPGQTIMLKSVPAAGMRQRGPAPQISRPGTQSAIRMNSRVGPGRHPAPLPDVMKQYQPPNWKALPPAPDLKLSKVENGIVISWKIEGYQEDSYEEIASYQLYAYQETSSPPSTTLWKKIGDVKALPLPMACTLTQFMAGFKYYFAVRAVDIRSRLGPFSLPGSILLLNKL